MSGGAMPRLAGDAPVKSLMENRAMDRLLAQAALDRLGICGIDGLVSADANAICPCDWRRLPLAVALDAKAWHVPRFCEVPR